MTRSSLWEGTMGWGPCSCEDKWVLFVWEQERDWVGVCVFRYQGPLLGPVVPVTHRFFLSSHLPQFTPCLPPFQPVPHTALFTAVTQLCRPLLEPWPTHGSTYMYTHAIHTHVQPIDRVSSCSPLCSSPNTLLLLALMFRCL